MAVSFGQINATPSSITVEVSGLDFLPGLYLKCNWYIVKNDGSITTDSDVTFVDATADYYNGESITYKYTQLTSTYADYCDENGEYWFAVEIDDFTSGTQNIYEDCYGTLEQPDDEEGNYIVEVRSVKTTSIIIRIKGLDSGDVVKMYTYNSTTGYLVDDDENTVNEGFSTTSVNASQLQPYTEYEFDIYINDEYYDTIYETTSYTPYSYEIITPIKDTHVDIKINNVSIGDEIRVYLENKTESYDIRQDYIVDCSPFLITIDSLVQDTEYIIDVRVKNDEISDRLGIKEFKTTKQNLIPSSVVILDSTDTTINIKVDGELPTTNSGIVIKYTGPNGVSSIRNYSVYILPCTLVLDGLQQNTEYKIDVRFNTSQETWYGEQSYKTKKTRPQNWNWQSTVGQNAIIRLTAEEWNAFTKRINEFRAYKDDLQPYNFTEVKSIKTNHDSLSKINASIINEARDAIIKISGYNATCLPRTVYQEDTIEASIFNDLAKALETI